MRVVVRSEKESQGQAGHKGCKGSQPLAWRQGSGRSGGSPTWAHPAPRPSPSASPSGGYRAGSSLAPPAGLRLIGLIGGPALGSRSPAPELGLLGRHLPRPGVPAAWVSQVLQVSLQSTCSTASVKPLALSLTAPPQPPTSLFLGLAGAEPRRGSPQWSSTLDSVVTNWAVPRGQLQSISRVTFCPLDFDSF